VEDDNSRKYITSQKEVFRIPENLTYKISSIAKRLDKQNEILIK